jgi:2-polyprenyl-3-methyl-5-hydroxy-6-metoxy-1,4-benzoquinol methylase
MMVWTDFPWSAALRMLRRLLPASLRASLRSYRRLHVCNLQWDSDYASGAWKRLRSVQELPRYSVIAGYCRHYRPFGSVLDIGCGEGLLARWLVNDCRSYFGVDLSAEAIVLARAKNLPFAEFVVANAEEFQSSSRFDVIVFNECLIYFDRPWELVARLTDALAPDGVIIVSLNEGVMSSQIWRMLRSDFHDHSQVEIRSGNGAWKIAVLQPRLSRNTLIGMHTS